MMDIEEVGRSIAAIHRPTENLLTEWDEKATAAIVLQKPTAVLLAPADVRAVTATIRSMLAVHASLFWSLKNLHLENETWREHVAMLNGEKAADSALIQRALDLIAEVRDMDLSELREFQERLRGGKP